MRHGKDDQAVSPVIGVMLMIVVTIIIAAIVSAFAGGYANTDEKAPTAVVTCKYMPATTSSNADTSLAGTINRGTLVAIPYGGIFCTVESGDYFDLQDVYFVVSSGAASRRFTLISSSPLQSLQKVNALQYDTKLYGPYGPPLSTAGDSAMNAGNQFVLAGENSGSGGPAGAYLGWSSSPALYLTNNQTAAFTLTDKESGRTISSGRIEYDG